MKHDEHLQPEEQQDPTISHLLSHLKMLRATVPVNYELKESLRAKLLERMRQMELQAAHSKRGAMTRKRRGFWWYTGGLLVLMICGFFWFGQVENIHFAAQELMQLTNNRAHSISLSASGKWLAQLSEDGRLAVQSLDEKATHKQMHQLPRTSGSYPFIDFANNDEQLAVIEETATGSRIWVIQLSENAKQASSRLLYEEKSGRLLDINWSPDNLYLAFTREEGGRTEVWIASTIASSVQKLIDGSQPAWSPDGTRVGFVSGENVSVLDLNSGKVQTLQRGSSPSWQAISRLTFITPDGKMAEYEWEQAMEPSKKIDLPKAFEKDIVSAEWTMDGRHGLVIQRTDHALRGARLSKE